MKIRVKLPDPHPAQLDVLNSKKRFNALCCGRRWGKTVIGLDRAIRPALAKKRVAWFAPSYKILDDAWQVLDETLKPLVRKRDASKHRLDLYGGGVVECWSLDDKDAGRGRAYHRIIIDEAAMVKNLEAAWTLTIRPMLSDYQGDAWFLSTPKGIASYFHTLWLKGQDPLDKSWASWQMPTLTNPHIKPEEIEAAREDLTDLAFAQEYLAQFVAWAGQVFRRIMDAVERSTKPGPAVMIGIDWGRTGDYTVFVALSAAGEVVGIDRFRGIEYQMQRDRLRAFWERMGGRFVGGRPEYPDGSGRWIGGEPTAPFMIAELNSMGAPVVEQLQQDGLPVYGFQTTNQTKAAIVQALALGFERDIISIPNDMALIGELQAFEGKKTPSGLMKYSAPEGVHDDMVLALAMSWAGLLMPGNPTSTWQGASQISPV